MNVTFLIVNPWQSFVCFDKIRCNPVHPLNGALLGLYVPARVTRVALVAHRYTYAVSLQNLAVQQDFYSLFGVPLERSY